MGAPTVWSDEAVAVLIDEPLWWFRGRRWSHLVSDTSLDELHEFATAAGMPRRGFQGDHYDVPEELHDVAIAAGAQAVGGRELLSRLMAAGLRRKAHGEARRPRDGPVRTPVAVIPGRAGGVLARGDGGESMVYGQV